MLKETFNLEAFVVRRPNPPKLNIFSLAHYIRSYNSNKLLNKSEL